MKQHILILGVTASGKGRLAFELARQINGEIIKEIYGTDLRMIRHDHRCSEGGHEHDRDCKSPF